MQVRSIILGALAVPVIFGFFKLVIDVEGDKKAAVDDAELERALSQYERRDRARSAEPSMPSTSGRSRKAATRRTTPEPEEVETIEATGSEEAREFEEPLREAANLNERMADANRMYDKGDYETSRDAALEILQEHPENVRMLRIVVSSSCIMGEPELATKYYEVLPARDQRQMARRCERYGVEFESE